MTTSRIGFVGVGKMGANVARRLAEKGYVISGVNDASQTQAETLARELNVVAQQSLKGLTASSEIIFTFVTDDAAMESIFTRPDDNLLIGAEGRTFVNCATFSPGVHRRIAQLVAAAGAFLLEAPMASSVSQARAGTLYLMCAGDQGVYGRLAPLLSDISVEREYVGEIGKALQLKALVNMVMNMNTAALAEGLGLASALGFDLQTVVKVFGKTGAASRVLETDAPDMINRDHEAFFTADHAAKDSGIALELAREVELDLPLAALTKQRYDLLSKNGFGNLDKSAISELTFKERLRFEAS